MTEKPRRWFQIHLSTAIVLMFVAGTLLLPNIRQRCSFEGTISLQENNGSMMDIDIDREVSLGWPFVFRRFGTRSGFGYFLKDSLVQNVTKSPRKISRDEILTTFSPEHSQRLLAEPEFPASVAIQWKSLSLNILIALILVLSTAIICEWIVRREARKP